jgi:hypothetical protein
MSTKKYKVAVSEKVIVPVEGKIADENGTPRPFKFSLVCKRLDAESLTQELGNKDESAAELIMKLTTGWRDQRLVLEEDETTPAEFCEDALSALLGIGGMAMQCLNAYLAVAGVKAKN